MTPRQTETVVAVLNLKTLRVGGMPNTYSVSLILNSSRTRLLLACQAILANRNTYQTWLSFDCCRSNKFNCVTPFLNNEALHM